MKYSLSSLLMVGFIAVLMFTLATGTIENFSLNPLYAYPATYDGYYDLVTSDVHADMQKCKIRKGLNTQCVNSQLLRTGGDLGMAMSLCGGEKVDPNLYKYKDYLATEPDYMNIMPLVTPTKSQRVPTYEFASKRHFY